MKTTFGMAFVRWMGSKNDAIQSSLYAAI
jgi:hypothetical protein